MSFSSEVKDELSRQLPQARHCRIAEITAIISMCGRILIDQDNHYRVLVHTENIAVARKYFELVRRTFNDILPEISIRQNILLKNSRIYSIVIKDPVQSMTVLQAAKLVDETGEIRENLSLVNNRVIQSSCCKRAFIRGAFLSTGSMSDPNKSYHFEIVCSSEAKARQIQELIGSFDMDAKIVCRKRYFVVYLKEGAQIVDLLNVMEAHVALMDLENVRILKEMRNSVNRKVNCETANIHKTVSAAVKQTEDIRYLKAAGGFSDLSEELLETADLRLENPEASLKELGLMHNPPIGKSGVNHRLRKLSNLAETLRGSKEEHYYD